jgi:fucose permease
MIKGARIPRSLPVLLIAAFYSFIVLGLPDGMMGVAWPSMSEAFGQPLGALGILMLCFTLGYLSTSLSVGLTARRIGYAALFTLAAGAMLTGGFGLAVAPTWLLALGAAAVLGAGAGWLDAGLNAYGAAYFRPRDLNWLHAFYGVGATLGPAVMTPIVASRLSWRLGYAAFGVTVAAMLVAFVMVRRRWKPAAADPDTGAGKPDAGSGARRPSPRRLAVVVGSALVFFLYSGVEVVTGQWAFSLFTIGRGIPDSVAGPWISAYWGALTGGRLLFGWIAERVRAMTLLRMCIAGGSVGIALIWIGSPPFLGAAGLVILGFSLAPMFPLLIGETPKRVGGQYADHAVGLQIAAANIGAVSLVGAVGFGVETVGLEIVGPVLAVNMILFMLGNELVERAAVGRKPQRVEGGNDE